MTTALSLPTLEAHIAEVFAQTPALFIAEKSEGLDGCYQVVFTDLDCPWFTQIQGAQCTTHAGLAADPVVVMTVSASDFIDITYGRLKETLALMTGRLKLEGNLIQAVKYSKLFRKMQ